MSQDETPVVQIKRMDVEVEDCGQIYFLDKEGGEALDPPSPSVGLIAMEQRGLAPQRDPAVLKTTSQAFQYLLDPKSWESQ